MARELYNNLPKSVTNWYFTGSLPWLSPSIDG